MVQERIASRASALGHAPRGDRSDVFGKPRDMGVA